MRIKKAFDLDMVLNDMAFQWEAWMRVNFDPNFCLAQIRYFGYILDAYGTEADDYWRDPKCYDTISPLPGAVDLLRELGKEAFIITHTPPGQSSTRKDAWIGDHFGDIRVVHSGDKWQHSNGCVMIDDHPGHIQRHIRHNSCHGVVFNFQDKYGWSNPLLPSSHVTKCESYEGLLKTIEEIHRWKP